MNRKNIVHLSGTITKEPYRIESTELYITEIAAVRLSGAVDTIPLVVPAYIADELEYGVRVSLNGEYRSKNCYGTAIHKKLYVFCKDVCLNLTDEYNEVYLDGYICQKPVYRETPLGKQITDILLAVNRPYGKSDYINCICWGRNAILASGYNVGDHVLLQGRIQSRDYEKQIGDIMGIRTAYEVSVSKIERVEE